MRSFVLNKQRDREKNMANTTRVSCAFAAIRAKCLISVLLMIVCLCCVGCGKSAGSGSNDAEVGMVQTIVPTQDTLVLEQLEGTESVTLPLGVPETEGQIAATWEEEIPEETLQETNDTTVTIMIYMDAATLESGEEPFASYDMEQMFAAQLSEDVNVLIQTGGTRKWTNSEISTQTTQRYRIVEGSLELMEDTGVQQDMTEAETLQEFIVFGAKVAPAERYMLILWGHGRGPEIGYGMDDFQRAGKAMALDDIAAAIETASTEADITFEWIGFDACLMGNLETVYALRNSCEYLAVSEDYEPAYGWQYTRLFQALSENPRIENDALARVIVDGFMEEAERSGDRGIMAVVDMSYAEELMMAWEAFCTAQDAAATRNEEAQDENAQVADGVETQLTVAELIRQVWTDESLLTPVPTATDGYVTDDYLYSLQDYGLTDVQAICELAGTPEAEAMMELLQRSIVCVESFHMARTMCGLAVCE